MPRAVPIALALTLAASAVAADCDEAAKVYGEVLRASEVCNFSPPLDVGRAERATRASCPDPDGARASIEVGGRTFDRDRGRRGLHEACFSFKWAQRFEDAPR